MLDIRFVRDNAEAVQQKLSTRGGAITGLDELLALDVQRREQLHRLENLRAERNRASDEIAAAKKQKQAVQPERFG
jgi:seryl-tRNA synthetase